MALTLSPIQFRDSKLLFISFDDTRQEGLPGLDSLGGTGAPDARFFTLGVDRNLQYEESGEQVACMGTLRFKWDIKSSDEDDAVVVASVEGAMGALATCPSDVAALDVVKKTLAANTLSYIWSKLRTIVEQLSAQSTIGMLSLPTIDPVELIED